MRKSFLSRFVVFVFCSFVLLCVGLFLHPSRTNAAQPNIILINMDDMGWGDLCKDKPDSLMCMQYRCDFFYPDVAGKCTLNSDCASTPARAGCVQSNTPGLDKLSDAGVRLTNFYTPSPLCTPSRAALMTGQDPRRTGALLSVSNTVYLKETETTLPEVLLSAGYNTAIIGKWNLGWVTDPTSGKETNSWNQGFEYNYSFPVGVGQNNKGLCLAEKKLTDQNPTWYYIADILNYGYEQYQDVGIDIDACNPAKYTRDDSDTGCPANTKDVCTAYTANGKKMYKWSKYVLPNTPEVTWSGYWAYAQSVYSTAPDKLYSLPSDAYSLTRVLTEKAKDYIMNITKAAETKARPFFLYLAYPTPHTPLHIHLKQSQQISTALFSKNGTTVETYTPQEVQDACEKKAAEATCDEATCKDNIKYLSARQRCEIEVLYPEVINGVDFNVGLMLNALNETPDPRDPAKSLKENTIIIFTSDNGPYMGDAAEYQDHGSTGGFRGGKKFTYEGGVRVPFVALWPNNWKVGYTPVQGADMTDIFTTLVVNGTQGNVTANLDGTTTINYTDKDVSVSSRSITVDGKDISAVLKSGAIQSKDIQISWFGNYPICVKWTDPGVCDDTCTVADGKCDNTCQYVDADGMCAGLPGYAPSHPFAIRSYTLDKSGILDKTSNFKLYIASVPPTPKKMLTDFTIINNPPASRKISKPIELYNIYPKYNPREIKGSNLCLSTILKDSATNSAINCCQSCESSSVCICGDSTWDAIYSPIVKDLWKKAEDYDKKVRPDLY